jgi:hypothetical protein
LQKLGTKVAQFQVDSLTSSMGNLQKAFGATKKETRVASTHDNIFAPALLKNLGLVPATIESYVSVDVEKTEEEL